MSDPLKLPHLEALPAARPRTVEPAVRPSYRRPRVILGVLAAITVGLLVHALTAPQGKGGVTRPPPVEVGRVKTRSLKVRAHTIGTVLAAATVNVTSQVAGQLLRADFKEGQVVRKGHILFELDNRPFEAALQQAQADLARDQAQLVAARRDARRYDLLFAQNAISAQQRDQYVAQAGALAGTVDADRAAVAIARLNLDYATIRSPITGRTGPILIQPGNLVKANDTNPLVVVTQIKPIKVSFFLPQSDLPRIEQQMARHRLVAEISPHGSKRVRSAPVDFIGNQVSGQTGTIELRATFANRDGALVPGELVDVRVVLRQLKDATVVPSAAINIGPDGHYVYALDRAHIAHKIAVRLRYDNATLAAVRGRLTPGMRVITVGQLRVVPLQKVEVWRPTSVAAATSPHHPVRTTSLAKRQPAP